MAKYTIEVDEERLRVIKVVKSVMDITNIDQAIAFIVEDYAKTKSYQKFIDEKRKGVKK